MKRNNRHQQILDLLITNGEIEVDAIADQFGISKMTVHRDLDELEAQGLLRKIRGGATMEPGTQFESDFQFRTLQNPAVKSALAEAAISLVEPGMTVIVNDGSTAAVIGSKLVEKRPVSVITNNDAVIGELKGKAGANLIALGGTYSSKYNAFFGKVTEDALANLRADIAFISTPAVQGEHVFHMDEAVVRTKRAMMNAANKSVLLVDHHRLNQSALHRLAGLGEFDTLITDEHPNQAFVDVLNAHGTKMLVATK